MRNFAPYLVLFAIMLCGTSTSAAAGPGANLPEIPLVCGASPTDQIPMRTVPRRTCGPQSPRRYRPAYHTIAHEVLDLESEQCRASDEAYQLLDTIISDVRGRVKYEPFLGGVAARVEQAERISLEVAAALRRHGFGLRVPTDTLADALGDWRDPAESAKHLYDCDTGSLIFLAVGEVLGLPINMVDALTSQGSRHNFVRWRIDDELTLDWDVNLRAWCTPPAPQPSWALRAMTRDEVMGYRYAVRASIYNDADNWRKALPDYWRAHLHYSSHPGPLNGIAWVIVTKAELQDEEHLAQALTLATRAVAVDRHPDHLDTLACAQAANGLRDEAIRTQTEAVRNVRKPDDRTDFVKRLKIIKDGGTCVGQ